MGLPLALLRPPVDCGLCVFTEQLEVCVFQREIADDQNFSLSDFNSPQPSTCNKQ